MAARIDLDPIQRGDTIPFLYKWGPENARIDMRGKTLIMTFKFSALQGDNEAVLTKSITFAQDDMEAANGETGFRLERSESAQLQAGVTYSYGIRLISPDSPEDFEETMIYGDAPVVDV